MNTEFNAKLTAAHNSVCRRFRQYRGIEVCYEGCKSFTIKKIWNNGEGVLELWNIDLTERQILINLALFNQHDKKHLTDFLNQFPQLKDFEAVGVYYGYPVYYNWGFTSKKLPGERIAMSLN